MPPQTPGDRGEQGERRDAHDRGRAIEGQRDAAAALDVERQRGGDGEHERAHRRERAGARDGGQRRQHEQVGHHLVGDANLMRAASSRLRSSARPGGLQRRRGSRADADDRSGADRRQRSRVGRDHGQRAQDALGLGAADRGAHLAAAHREPDAEAPARQLDAHARRLRDRALERRRVGGRARLVVEHDRGLARLLVFFLAHQRDAPARARPPVDVARIVAIPVGAQPAELALPAGRERLPRRRVGRQPAHQRLRRRAATPGRRTARPRRRSRARAAGARTGTSSPAGSPTGGSARAAPSCCGTPSLARDPAGSFRK